MSDVAIRLSAVTKTYGSGQQATRALERLDLEVGKGDFVSVMGPSGSGKTTLLNLMAGLDTPETGEVVVEGTSLAALADHQLADLRLRKVGFVFQAFNLIPALTVEENVAWPLEFSGCGRTDVRHRTADALRRVGAAGRERRYPGELSGGEQQRVAIARAIVTRPSILLADEPTGNLDTHTGQTILDLIAALSRVERVTVVMVTHNAAAAMYGDRTVEMQDGRIVREVRIPRRPNAATGATGDRGELPG
jgi:putative ABC transport system ATP-binding protein